MCLLLMLLMNIVLLIVTICNRDVAKQLEKLKACKSPGPR